MLHEETLKQIRERDWLEVVKNYSNPSVLTRKVRESIAEYLSHLTVFARKIPENELESFMPKDRLIELILSLLKERSFEDTPLSTIISGRGSPSDFAIHDDNVPNTRKAFLASSLAEISISHLMRQYRSLNPDPRLSVPVTDRLQELISMCKAIAETVERRKQDEKAIQENRDYLFKWEEIPGKDENRLLNFLESEHGQSYQKIEFAKENYDRTLLFKTRIGRQDIDMISGKIEINSDWKTANMTFDKDDKTIIHFKLNRDDNGTYLFKKKKVRDKESL